MRLRLSTRGTLWMLLVAGIVLHAATAFLAYSPQKPLTEAVGLAVIVYMVSLPLAVWFVKGETRLRIIVVSVWAVYVVFFWIFPRS